MFTRVDKAKLSIALKAAQDIVAQSKKSLPVDIYAVANFLGFAVEEAEIQASGYIPEGENVIVVRRADIATRKRFTVAHEIGHILWRKFCAQPSTENRVFRKRNYSEEEIIANCLATELLMPKSEFQ